MKPLSVNGVPYAEYINRTKPSPVPAPAPATKPVQTKAPEPEPPVFQVKTGDLAEAYEELKSDWELALEALGLPPTAESIEVICTIHRIKEKAEGIQPDLGTD